MNFKNKEYTDGILAALSLASRAPGAIGAIGKIAGIAFTADEIAEAFGKNIFTDSELNKKVDEIAKNFTEGNRTNKLESSSVKKSDPPKPEAAKPAPTTSMTPSATNLQINAPDISQSVTEKEPYTSQSVIEKEPYTSQPATQKAPDISQPATQKAPTVQPAVQPQTPIIPPPSPEMIKNFQMAWNYRNNGFARGRIESAWNKLSPEEQQQAKAWAKSTGKDWTEMKLTDKNQISSVRPKETPKSVETSPKPSTAKITPAQTTKMQTVPFNIGPEPEPKPNIVYPPSGPSAPQEKQPYSIGAASNVPNIPSSNPDNFYTLYSQINYNVVM
jgi:hypothetical protein